MVSGISKTIIALTFTLAFLYGEDIRAQSGMKYMWYANANLGISQLYSDIQDNGNHISKLKSETSFGYGLRFGRYISPVFAINFQGLYANFKGEKMKSNLKFESGLIETQLGATVNLSNLVFGTTAKRRVFVYATTGIGLVFYKSKYWKKSSGVTVAQFGYSESENGKYDNTAFVMPIGFGIDYKINDKWFVNFESVLRFTNVDNLDAKESGNRRDAYYYTSLGVSYSFGFKAKKKSETIPREPVVAEISEAVVKPRVEKYPVSLTYDLPDTVHTFDTITVRSTINTGSFTGKAELAQILPVGFELIDTIVGGVKADYKNYTLNMFWDHLPEDSIIEISYRVVIDKIYGLLPIVSLFYLEETGREYKFTGTINIKKASPPQVVATTDIGPGKNIGYDLKANDRIRFKIQIRAENKTAIPLQRLANKYHIREQITEEHYDEWYRYSVGLFTTYNEAKEYRDKVRKEYNISDAFIVAYFNGERLSSLSELKKLAPEALPGEEWVEAEKPLKQPFYKAGRTYRVQIYAVKNDRIDVAALKKTYDIDEPVTEERSYQWSRYTVGNFRTFAEANRLRKKMAAKGVKGAFVVTYENGKRVIVDELDY